MTDWFLSEYNKKLNYNFEIIKCSYSTGGKFMYIIRIIIDKNFMKIADPNKYFEQVLVVKAKELAERYKIDMFEGFTYKYAGNILYIINDNGGDQACFTENYDCTINGHISTCNMLVTLEILHTLINKYLTDEAMRETKGVLPEYDATKELKFKNIYLKEFDFNTHEAFIAFNGDISHKMSGDAVDKQLHDIFVTKAQELLAKYKVPVTSNPFSFKKIYYNSVSIQIKIQEETLICKDTIRTVIEIFGILIDFDLSSKSEVGCSLLNVPFYFNFKTNL